MSRLAVLAFDLHCAYISAVRDEPPENWVHERHSCLEAALESKEKRPKHSLHQPARTFSGSIQLGSYGTDPSGAAFWTPDNFNTVGVLSMTWTSAGSLSLRIMI